MRIHICTTIYIIYIVRIYVDTNIQKISTKFDTV